MKGVLQARSSGHEQWVIVELILPSIGVAQRIVGFYVTLIVGHILMLNLVSEDFA